MDKFRPLYQDPFSPVLYSSEVLNVTQEQKSYIKEILDVACSDSRFAAKALEAITIVLTAGSVKLPVISSLTPNNAALGSPSFLLHVHGSEFDEGSKIIWNGAEEPTTRVSDSELTTGVNMDTAEVAMDIPVMVQNSKGVTSNVSTFTLTPAAPI